MAENLLHAEACYATEHELMWELTMLYAALTGCFFGRNEVSHIAFSTTSLDLAGKSRWLSETRQYYGNYEVNGVEVGVSTVEIASSVDIIETFGRGSLGAGGTS